MKDPKLVRQYRLLDKDIALFDDKLHGLKTCETILFIPTPQNRTLMQGELDNLFKRQQALAVPDEVFSIMKDHLSDFLDGLQLDLNNWYNVPSARIISTESRTFTTIFRRDTRADKKRIAILETRMEQYDALFAALFVSLADKHDGELTQMLNRLNYLKTTVEIEKGDCQQFLPMSAENEVLNLKIKMQAFADNVVGKWIATVEEMIADRGGVAAVKPREESETIPADIEGYRKALLAHGVDLDDMISWYEADIEKSRNECFMLANALDIPEKPVTTMTEVNDILFKYAGPCDSAEELFSRATEYVTRGTAAAREYVWLPPDSDCPPSIMNKQMKASYPWGAGGSASPYSRPFEGRFMLNDENYKAITDGWIKINCIHEVNPGHYTQFLRMHIDPLPETFKRGAKHTCLTEAMCIRTEKVFEFIFAEDPFYPLFTAYRRHHTTVRIMVDLWLRYFGKTIGDVVELYIKELGFDRVSARKQVQAHENDNGYFTTYYYGYKLVNEWEKIYGFDPKEYTEQLFSAGRVSLNTFERILKLSPEDRFDLQHQFASLLQFA